MFTSWVQQTHLEAMKQNFKYVKRTMDYCL